MCLQVRFFDDVENSLRLRAVLRDGATLGAASAVEQQTIDSHARQLRLVLTTAYNLIERKLFALPKFALLPALLYHHPSHAVAGLAMAAAVDALKSKMVATLTETVEELNREMRRLNSQRARVEAHDAQHASLLRAAHAEEFTRQHWSALTTQVQGLGCRIASLQGLRDWIRWLYWQDVLNPGVECGDGEDRRRRRGIDGPCRQGVDGLDDLGRGGDDVDGEQHRAQRRKERHREQALLLGEPRAARAGEPAESLTHCGRPTRSPRS